MVVRLGQHDEGARHDVHDRVAIDSPAPPRPRALGACLRRLRAICRSLDGAVARSNEGTSGGEPLIEPSPGRWTICDCFQVGQTQYVITRFRPALKGVAAMRGTLSSRERTIVEDVANGGAHKVVAADHGISVQAVSTYLARARRKLGVTSRADLIQAVLWNDDRATARCRGDVATQVVLNGEHFRLIRRPIGALGGFTQGLTSAERDILSGILQGLKNTEIARMRATSVRTVAAQVSVLMRKLGAMSRAELVAVVLRA